MDHIASIEQYLTESLLVKQKLMGDYNLLSIINQVTNKVIEAYEAGNKVLLAGNGGSAADAQHIAAEFVSRFMYDRPGLPAVALTTDTSMLTAIGNDYGFDKLFSRQVQAQGQAGDIFIGITTSGNSKNILSAVETAKAHGLATVVLCGSGGAVKSMVDYAIEIPSDCTPYIQESHIVIGHIICNLVEKSIFPL